MRLRLGATASIHEGGSVPVRSGPRDQTGASRRGPDTGPLLTYFTSLQDKPLAGAQFAPM